MFLCEIFAYNTLSVGSIFRNEKISVAKIMRLYYYITVGYCTHPRYIKWGIRVDVAVTLPIISHSNQKRRWYLRRRFFFRSPRNPVKFKLANTERYMTVIYCNSYINLILKNMKLLKYLNVFMFDVKYY